MSNSAAANQNALAAPSNVPTAQESSSLHYYYQVLADHHESTLHGYEYDGYRGHSCIPTGVSLGEMLSLKNDRPYSSVLVDLDIEKRLKTYGARAYNEGFRAAYIYTSLAKDYYPRLDYPGQLYPPSEDNAPDWRIRATSIAIVVVLPKKFFKYWVTAVYQIDSDTRTGTIDVFDPEGSENVGPSDRAAMDNRLRRFAEVIAFDPKLAEQWGQRTWTIEDRSCKPQERACDSGPLAVWTAYNLLTCGSELPQVGRATSGGEIACGARKSLFEWLFEGLGDAAAASIH